MTRSIAPVVATLVVAGVAHAQTLADEDFQDQISGTFPDCPWLDTAAIQTPPDVILPSALVFVTDDADGIVTRALQTRQTDWFDGIYAPLPVADRYLVRADVRVDVYDPDANPEFPAANWAMYVSVSQFSDLFPAGGWAGVGVYASAATQGWRLYVVGTDPKAPVAAEIDLELPAVAGVWYRVELEVLAGTESIHTRILDGATDAVLLDRVDVIPGLTPAQTQFDALACFDGDDPETPVNNQATIDNITYEVGYPAPTGDLDGDGVVGPADLAILLANWG